MAESLFGNCGGIVSLIALIREHGAAVEYDLIRHGFRLDDLLVTFSWRDLWVILTQQKSADAAVHRALNPDDSPWDIKAFLLAEAVDTLRVLAWFETKDGQKGRNRPKPIPRPGYRPKVFGKSKGMTRAEADVWLASRVAKK